MEEGFYHSSANCILGVFPFEGAECDVGKINGGDFPLRGDGTLGWENKRR